MKRRPPLTLLEAALILLVAFTWLYLYTGAIVRETRLERAFALDGKGVPVEVYHERGNR